LLPLQTNGLAAEFGFRGDAPLVFLFGDMVLDAARRELHSGLTLLAIEPQVFDLLEFLIRNRDRVVSRDDLVAAVWGGRLVSDSAITARINAVRRSIGDSGEQQRWIRTVARKGFRFVGDVREAPSRALSTPSEAVGPQFPYGAPPGQEITFCRTQDGVKLAVASVGQGLPLLRTGHWMTHVEYEWQNPLRRPLLDFLADRFRLICYDCRNNGLSGRGVANVSFEALQHDLETVVNAVGLGSYALLGISQGAPVSITHAARFPEQVSKIVLVGGYALGRNRRASRQGYDAFLTLMREGWGDEHSPFQKMLSAVFLPNASPEQVRWLADLQRMSSSAEDAVSLRAAFSDVDVVDVLPKVSAPTLVLHSRYDKMVPLEEASRIAASIPNAKLVALESETHVPRPFEPAWPRFLEAIETFLSDA
jgi:DNA-binding winged helix-turn-helix (wHTH) protein/pimeloyl-ACP methyl ester carboxylesterase